MGGKDKKLKEDAEECPEDCSEDCCDEDEVHLSLI